MVHQLPLVKHQLYILHVCTYQILCAVCFRFLLYVFFYTISMFVRVRIPVCLQHLCMYVPAVCTCVCANLIQPPPLPLHATAITTCNIHHHIHLPPPPPHSASNNKTTTCGSRVNALVGSGKRPPAQVTEGQDHMCT